MKIRELKLGDKVRFKMSWGPHGTWRQAIMVGDILTVTAIQPIQGEVQRYTFTSSSGFGHANWPCDDNWHEMALTDDEIDKAVPLPSIDELGRFVDGLL